MGSPVDLGEASQMADGTMKRVRVQGRDILLARVKGQYYAAEVRCPHMGADLSQGTLKGTVVTCPLHGSQFDLVDGRVLRWTNWTGLKLALAKILRSPRPLRVYPVRQESGRITVEM